MTEEYSKDNLASRTEEYLESIVGKNLEMCVEVLKQSEKLLPLAEELNIMVDALMPLPQRPIASRFSRLEYSSSGRLHMSRQVKCSDDGGDWWIEDLSVLRIDLYQRVMHAMKCRGVRPESIGASLVSYAERELTKRSEHEQTIVEIIVTLFPVENLLVPISFLFGLLRRAVILDTSVSCRLDLERRIGSQLDMATLDDLLIPSFRHAGDTLFNIDTVHRLLVIFSQKGPDDSEDEEYVFECDSPHSLQKPPCLKLQSL